MVQMLVQSLKHAFKSRHTVRAQVYGALALTVTLLAQSAIKSFTEQCTAKNIGALSHAFKTRRTVRAQVYG